ncbi:transposable element Tcb1 transposase [Trichonephila clavipes]|nr:transposable element Tcb1 transposase [Trichonephila clavipes]
MAPVLELLSHTTYLHTVGITKPKELFFYFCFNFRNDCGRRLWSCVYGRCCRFASLNFDATEDLPCRGTELNLSKLKSLARVSQDCFPTVTTLSWPSRSPDLSPIEPIWDHLGQRVGHPTSLNELEARLQQIWNEMSQDIIQNLYVSMPDHIASCIRARGVQQVCRQMSVKTRKTKKKRSWPLYLMLRKDRYKAWINSVEALFHLSFTTGKTKIQHISSKKRRKDAAVLKNASWPSGVIAGTKMSSEG